MRPLPQVAWRCWRSEGIVGRRCRAAGRSAGERVRESRDAQLQRPAGRAVRAVRPRTGNLGKDSGGKDDCPTQSRMLQPLSPVGRRSHFTSCKPFSLRGSMTAKSDRSPRRQLACRQIHQANSPTATPNGTHLHTRRHCSFGLNMRKRHLSPTSLTASKSRTRHILVQCRRPRHGSMRSTPLSVTFVDQSGCCCADVPIWNLARPPLVLLARCQQGCWAIASRREIRCQACTDTTPRRDVAPNAAPDLPALSALRIEVVVKMPVIVHRIGTAARV